MHGFAERGCGDLAAGTEVGGLPAKWTDSDRVVEAARVVRHMSFHEEEPSNVGSRDRPAMGAGILRFYDLLGTAPTAPRKFDLHSARPRVWDITRGRRKWLAVRGCPR